MRQTPPPQWLGCILSSAVPRALLQQLIDMLLAVLARRFQIQQPLVERFCLCLLGRHLRIELALHRRDRRRHEPRTTEGQLPLLPRL